MAICYNNADSIISNLIKGARHDIDTVLLDNKIDAQGIVEIHNILNTLEVYLRNSFSVSDVKTVEYNSLSKGANNE